MAGGRIVRCCALLTAAWLLVACGGGSSSSPATTPLAASIAVPTGSNVALVEVRQGPADNVNIPYVSIRICAPGTSNCLTLPNVMVDTGSTGLRLFASQVNGALTLPDQSVGSSSSVFECANFITTSAWGRIKLADVLIGGERAASVPLQLMDASDAGAVKCAGAPLLSSAATAPNTPGGPANGTSALSANGILGVGLFSNDGQNYFDCASPGAGCSSIVSLDRAKQVQNPVALFAAQDANGVANNNGVVVQLPSLQPSGMASSAQGYLVFGVNTQSNNQLGTAHVLPVNAMGRFTTFYNGVALSDSFIDSGSNGLYFPAAGSVPALSNCSGNIAAFFCPSPGHPVALSAGIQLADAVFNVDFSIANASEMFLTGSYALGSLGGNLAGRSFDWGLPFFFGRSVYTVIEGSSTNAPTGSLARPFHAFTN